MTIYRVILIHRLHDWDAVFEFQAPDAKTARKWALMKLTHPSNWLVVRASRMKALK